MTKGNSVGIKNSGEQHGVLKTFGLLVAMLLPVIGVALTIVFLLASKKADVKKIAKAMLLVHLCFVIMAAVLACVVGIAVNKLKEQYPQLENAMEYIKVFARDGVNGLVDALSENGELQTMIETIDMNKLLAEVDTQVLLKSLDTEKLLKNIDIADVVSAVDTRQILEMIEPQKLAEYINFETLIDSIDEKTLESWKAMIGD